MTDAMYDKIKKFILSLPEGKWVIIDSIRAVNKDTKPIFIEACKKMIEEDSGNYRNSEYKNVYLSFNNDYSAIRLFEVFSNNLKSKQWD